MTRIFAVLGPTASGKSEVALELAARRGAPIISVDSMQVYRGMDIGTAKATVTEQAEVRHYMIDLIEPDDEYSVAEFQREARRVLNDHEEAFIVGGSGLHFRSIVDPLQFPPTDPTLRAELERIPDPAAVLVGADPGAGKVVDLHNPRRVVRALEILHLTGLTPSKRARTQGWAAIREYRPLLDFKAIALNPGMSARAQRIRERVATMRDAGLWEEVAHLRGRLGRTAAGAVGYRELVAAMDERISVDSAWDLITQVTCSISRRQHRWFARDPRVVWLRWTDDLDERVTGAREVLGL